MVEPGFVTAPPALQHFHAQPQARSYGSRNRSAKRAGGQRVSTDTLRGSLIIRHEGSAPVRPDIDFTLVAVNRLSKEELVRQKAV